MDIRLETQANWITLQFLDRELEREYCIEYLARSLAQIRLALVVGFGVFATFGILDGYIIPEAQVQAWFISMRQV